MSTINAPRHTCPSNATTRPGQIVLDAQVKRRTKAQKNADDLALKKAKEAKEAQTQKGLERLAGMQNEMEQAQEELLTKKTAPIWPKPRARKVTKPVVGNGDNHTGSLMDADEADSHQEAVKNMWDETAGAKKRVMKKGGKPLIRDTISDMQGKISKASSKVEGDNTMTRVSDGKDAPMCHILYSGPMSDNIPTPHPDLRTPYPCLQSSTHPDPCTSAHPHPHIHIQIPLPPYIRPPYLHS
ncbi:uncharacterized protein F5891DRAFT_1192511 [Suillus fuscotomentosus]|uniref:Uncharacterized protein n=1 Tax=Suillus fuscotomentosus TaxID=1912939 RepID=A0AAD4E033_9AGAM|nr:uncharacterized protein F5891DRAFT_1192511 [Suillus fuscotomentosus]KAG1896852.1 hypothetical protein F5891DRAFT_1192511 [Suillus fuscotomentosus]